MTYLIIGGAGFIGSNIVKHIIDEEQNAAVYIYDNFSSGEMWHLPKSDRLEIFEGDIKDLPKLTEVMGKGVDIVYSFASNPDIAKAMSQPDIDFIEGTLLINNILEAMRVTGTKKLLYASGSGVYGDVGETETAEDFSPMRPISTYGASKLSCEALICAYSYMFGIDAAAFRFANVVGPNQTHGVGRDFLQRLVNNSSELSILGDGTQSKSYIYVDDVIAAVRLVEKEYLQGYDVYNVGTDDFISVTEIADLACETVGVRDVCFKYTGGDRGWKGDVPIVRLNTQKIRKLGWTNKRNSRQAMYESMSSMFNNKNIIK